MGNPEGARVPEEQRLGPVLRRREQVQPGTTDQRLLDTEGDSEWVHTDPWRVMRIQSEFVEDSARWPNCRARSASSARPAPRPADPTTRRVYGSARPWWRPVSR